MKKSEILENIRNKTGYINGQTYTNIRKIFKEYLNNDCSKINNKKDFENAKSKLIKTIESFRFENYEKYRN